jgi:hypothetical protein
MSEMEPDFWQTAPNSAPFAFIALETLPCGCITGVYWTRPDLVKLELVEAKGPNCVFFDHKVGEILEN